MYLCRRIGITFPVITFIVLYLSVVRGEAGSKQFSMFLDKGEELVFSGQIADKHRIQRRWILVSRKSLFRDAPMLYSYTVYLIADKTRSSDSYRCYVRQPLEGEGDIEIVFGKLTGKDGSDIFISVTGQRTTGYVFHIGEQSLELRYKREEGRSRIGYEDTDNDGVSEVVVYDSYLHNFVSEEIISRWCGQIRGHPFLKYIYKYRASAKGYVLTEILPDTDAEAKATVAEWAVVPMCSD